MAVIRVQATGKELAQEEDVRNFLSARKIQYEKWDLGRVSPELVNQSLFSDSDKETVLSAYESELQDLRNNHGYIKVDVIALSSKIPGIEEKLDVFRKEHLHTEDEVRFILDGRGIFFIHPENESVFEIEVHAGDFISVPAYTWHWFDLCQERHIKAIRLFQKEDGWVPVYREPSLTQSAQS
jgi:1,2-dihydroxy-3-keto-5-methylthiopentene dioxygenase